MSVAKGKDSSTTIRQKTTGMRKNIVKPLNRIY